MESVAWHLSLGFDRLRLWLGFLRLGTIAWDLSLGISRLGFFAPDTNSLQSTPDFCDEFHKGVDKPGMSDVLLLSCFPDVMEFRCSGIPKLCSLMILGTSWKVA